MQTNLTPVPGAIPQYDPETGADLGNYILLANLAECGSPDHDGSPGARFLLGVAESHRDDLPQYDDREDGIHEIADGAVPVYTHAIWSTFVDLAAYREDVTEYGVDGSDLEQAAKVALYMIAERLLYALEDEAVSA